MPWPCIDVNAHCITGKSVLLQTAMVYTPNNNSDWNKHSQYFLSIICLMQVKKKKKWSQKKMNIRFGIS